MATTAKPVTSLRTLLAALRAQHGETGLRLTGGIIAGTLNNGSHYSVGPCCGKALEFVDGDRAEFATYADVLAAWAA